MKVEGRKSEMMFAGLLSVGLALLLIRPVVLRPTWWLWKPGAPASDLAVTHWPNAHFTRRTVWEERGFPLWRPTIMSGTPFAANPLAALYYVPNWPLLFLPWIPLSLAFNLSALIHLALAGTTMYTLMRRGLDVTFWGSVIAAVSYETAPKLIAHLGAGHVGWVQAWAWLPLVVLCTLRACQFAGRQAIRWALGAGLVMAVQFCADVRLSAYTLAAAGSLVLTRIVGQTTERGIPAFHGNKRSSTPLSTAAGLAILVLTVFVGLSACQWLPGLALLPSTTRSTMTHSDVAVWSLPWRYLSGLLLADHGGFQEWMTYVGVSTLALACVGGRTLWRDRRGRWLGVWLIGLTVLAAWFSLGEHAGLFGALWRIVPGLGLLRVPPRAWVLVNFTMAVGAGFGLQAILQRRDRRPAYTGRWSQALLLGIAAFPPVLAVGYWLTTERPPLNLVMFSIITPLTIALYSVSLRTTTVTRCKESIQASATKMGEGAPKGRTSHSASWLGTAALLLVAADLLLVDSTLIEARSPREVFADGEKAAEWLADRPGRFRVYSPSYSLPQHVSEQYGLETADGVDPLQLEPYADYLIRAAGLQERHGYSVTLPPFPEGRDIRTALADVSPNTEMLGQLGVRYVAAAFPVDHHRLKFVHRLDDVYLYRNEDARPPAGRPSDPGIVLADGQVLFWYQPQAVYWGWAVSGVTFLGVSISLWRLHRRPASSRSRR